MRSKVVGETMVLDQAPGQKFTLVKEAVVIGGKYCFIFS
jgi:hypothetical protein